MWMWFYRTGAYKNVTKATVATEGSVKSVESPLVQAQNIEPELPVTPVFAPESLSLLEIRKCFQGNEKLQALLQKTDFKLQDFKDIKDIQGKSFDQINVHFDFEGKKLRLVLINEKGEGAKENVRLFEVGADGLPTRKPLPPNWEDKSQLEIFREVKKQFPITNLQKYLRWQLDNNTQMSFSDENGKLQDLMLTLKSPRGYRTLGCKVENSELNCKCVGEK